MWRFEDMCRGKVNVFNLTEAETSKKIQLYLLKI